jgi:hypothetical protein
MPWREEGSDSMRSLGYFIGTFAVALLLGIGSAWYAIDRGTPLTTETAGAWRSWTSEGHPDADVYTKAHVARSGRLPLTSTVARYFTARTDSSGRALTSSCEYVLTGSPINARWWSIALYNEEGGLIANPSDRYSFNNEELVRRADGTYRITLARNARPENWLPTGEPGQSLTLMLRVYSPRETDPLGIGLVPDNRLPTIERTTCE